MKSSSIKFAEEGLQAALENTSQVPLEIEVDEKQEAYLSHWLVVGRLLGERVGYWNSI